MQPLSGCHINQQLLFVSESKWCLEHFWWQACMGTWSNCVWWSKFSGAWKSFERYIYTSYADDALVQFCLLDM